MSHDGMPRAYLRIDPNLDVTQADPGSFIRLLCAAARQPDRGRFRDRALLDRAVGRAKTSRFIAAGDVSVQPDGRLYVEGWDEWQEGDYTVAERMRRMRHRRATKRNGGTHAPSHPRNDVTTDAVSTDSLSVVPLGDGDRDDLPPPPTSGGRRSEGTNPRATGDAPRDTGTNPRANGESIRQERDAQKRGPTAIGAIFAQLAEKEVPA
jgi:hypothetical protein